MGDMGISTWLSTTQLLLDLQLPSAFDVDLENLWTRAAGEADTAGRAQGVNDRRRLTRRHYGEVPAGLAPPLHSPLNCVPMDGKRRDLRLPYPTEGHNTGPTDLRRWKYLFRGCDRIDDTLSHTVGVSADNAGDYQREQADPGQERSRWSVLAHVGSHHGHYWR